MPLPLPLEVLFFRIIRQVFLSSEFNYVVSHETNTTSQHYLLSTALMKKMVRKKKNPERRNYAQRDDSGVCKQEKQQEFLSSGEKQMDTTVLGDVGMAKRNQSVCGFNDLRTESPPLCAHGRSTVVPAFQGADKGAIHLPIPRN